MECSHVVIVNYLTEGPGTGLCVEGEDRFLYQKQADGPILVPAGPICVCTKWPGATIPGTGWPAAASSCKAMPGPAAGGWMGVHSLNSESLR